MRRILGLCAAIAILTGLFGVTTASATPASTAALQAALKSLHLYKGHVDGIKGPLTRHAVVALQRRKHLAVDGIAGPRTRRALGWRGRPALGSRTTHSGNRGWDVAALQFLLQRAGYGPGRADGLFGPLTRDAVLRAQYAAQIAADGLAGPVTLRSLRGGSGRSTSASTTVSSPSGPVLFLRPVQGPIGDGFGAARAGGRLHQGLDFPVPYGTLVTAAGVGTTIYAGYNRYGYGNLVVIQHRLGYTTWYAHLSSITTWVGEQVSGGTRIGYVGSTGYSTGPHLHFETRRYDTPFDPIPRLLTSASAARAARSAKPKRASLAAHRDDCKARDHRARSPKRLPRGADWIDRERLCRAP